MVMTLISNKLYNESLIESNCVVTRTRIVKDEFCHSRDAQQCFNGFITLVLYGSGKANTTVTYCVFTDKTPEDAKHAIAQYIVGDKLTCYYDKTNIYIFNQL